MIWYLHWQCCHISLFNHRGHPWLLEYFSDSLISSLWSYGLSKAIFTEHVLGDSLRGSVKSPPWQLTTACCCGNFLFPPLYFFSTLSHLSLLIFLVHFHFTGGRHRRHVCPPTVTSRRHIISHFPVNAAKRMYTNTRGICGVAFTFFFIYRRYF